MEISANNDFAEWAKSFAGCDGGNISGAIWFCGIEFGGGDKEANLGFKPHETPPFVGDESRDKFKTWQYNWKTLKLYAAILGFTPEAYKTVYKNTKAFDESSDTFKMNLYPLAFHNESSDLWEKEHYKKTGFPSKPLYQAWCQLNRFPSITGWVTENCPKAIICTGSTYLREFLMAFSGPEDIFSKFDEKRIDGRDLFWKKINGDRTILFVIPFLGQGGLKSNEQIKDYGAEIKSICAKHFHESWCKYLKISR